MVLLDPRTKRTYVGEEANRILLASIREEIGYWGGLDALGPANKHGGNPLDAKRQLEQVLLLAWEDTTK